ncbi:MAG: CopG family antitoxin [bacterium]
MKKNRSSISDAASYEEIAEFWDTHDLMDFSDKLKEISFDVDLQSRKTYFALDQALSDRVRKLARRRGISAGTLVNLWVQEKLRDSKHRKTNAKIRT